MPAVSSQHRDDGTLQQKSATFFGHSLLPSSEENSNQRTSLGSNEITPIWNGRKCIHSSVATHLVTSQIWQPTTSLLLQPSAMHLHHCIRQAVEVNHTRLLVSQPRQYACSVVAAELLRLRFSFSSRSWHTARKRRWIFTVASLRRVKSCLWAWPLKRAWISVAALRSCRASHG